MKKILLSCAFLAGFTAAAIAQCTPGPNYANGVYPDSATNFVSGCKDVPYEQVISLKIPADTNVNYQGTNVTATIQSIELLSVTGLPTGFTLDCSTSNCKFNGGTTGCAVIQGTTSEVGLHNITFYLKTTASVSLGPIPVPVTQNDTLDYYKILIEDCGGVGVASIVMNNASFDVYPNPAKGNVTISKLMNDGNVKNIHIINAEGKTIKTISTEKESVSFSTESIKAGIYFVKVIQQGSQETVKLVIE